MNDVRDEALGTLLERAASEIESAPVDRLPEVLRRGSRKRVARFTAIGAAVAVFVGVISWAGMTLPRTIEEIPADVDDWRTFASLEEHGWTVQVPPSWRVQELPSCPNAPERIGVIVTNVDFEFLNPRGESPACEDRFVFQGFPSDGVALAFMPRGSIPGIFGALPDTTLPLAQLLLIPSAGIRGGPAESSLGIFLDGEWLGMLRRYEGPRATDRAVLALDRVLASFEVRGAPQWVGGHARSLGGIRVSFVRPDTWTFAGYPHAIVIDAPTPILRLRSPGIRGGGCELPGEPWIRVGRFDDYGVEIVVQDASETFGPTDLPPRPDSIGFGDELRRGPVTCRGQRLGVSTFGFEEAGRQIYVDIVATPAVYREQPQMLLYILNSIRVEET